MTTISTKIRAIGGASAIALTAGLSATAFAQAAPSPVQSVPNPAAPAAPANAEECALITTASPPEIVCAPGTDADGLQEPFNSISLTVEEGSQVQGVLSLLIGADVTVDGDIVNTTAGALQPTIDVGEASTITINGFVTSTTNFDGMVSAGRASTVTNNGTLLGGAPASAGIIVDADSVVVNNGLIANGLGNFYGILAGQTFAETGVTVTNSSTGSVILESNGITSAGMWLGAEATVLNDGLVQTFGDSGIGILVGDDSSVTNNGTIFTLGGLSNGVNGANGLTFVNGETGTIFTFGDNSAGVGANEEASVTNSGIISTDGANANAILVGANSTVTATETSQIVTDGDNSAGINVFGTATISNAGLIQTGGIGSDGIFVFGDATIDNSGTITSAQSDGIVVFGVATINNAMDGVISSANGDGILLLTDGSTITNAGLIEGTTGTAIAVDGLTGTTITNSGTIRTGNGAGAGISATNSSGLVVVNTGAISAETGIDATTSTGAAIVTNLGSIEGLGGTAAVLGDADDFFIVLDDGTVTGTVDGGAGTDVYAYVITDQTDREFDLGSDITNFEDIRVGSQTFDFLAGAVGSMPATGVVTLTGTGSQAITVVNTAILDGTNNGTISYIAGANDGITLGFTTTSNGVISTMGDGEIGFTGGDDVVLTNGGSILTTGMNTAGVLLGANASITNTGSIRSEGTNGVAIATGADASITNDAGATITTTGDNGFGIVVNGDGTLTNNGIVAVSGAGAQAVTITGEALVVNDGTIAASDGRAIDVALASVIANTDNGVIASSGADAIRMNAAMSTTSNAGTISSTADGSAGVAGVADSTVNNSGTISTSGTGTASVLLGDNGTVNNQGTITASGTNGVAVALGDGGTIVNVGMGDISSTGDDAPTVVIAGNGTITNEATISAGGANSQAVTVTGDLTLTNSGSITGADGRALDVAGVADITNTAGGTISATGADAIRFNSGSSITNNGTVDGDTGIVGSAGDDFVANFGTIAGAMDAVLLGSGADTFQQWTGASVTGNVDLGGDDDVFVLEGSSSSVTGTIDGGAGTDTAILAGVLDSDNFAGFETYQLGSQLGGTLTDLTISGDRTLTGDVVHTGVVTMALGVDTLTTTGSITLESTGVLNIETPLDEALLGQTVLVLRDGNGFVNNGATVNIIDDDLLLDYTPIIGSLRVRVTGVNALAGNADPNLDTFGGAVIGGVRNGTLSATNFATLNGLSADQFAAAGADALPSLSDGVGREIFESGSLASAALDRHLSDGGTGVWGQIAVRGAEQDALSQTADGYDSDQVVFTLGADFALGDDIRVGLLASYADIEVQDETATGALNSLSDVDSIRLGGYMAVTFFERGFINTELAYLTGEVDAARSGFFGPIASSYDFDGFATRTTLGYDLLADENVSITPTVGLNAARINFDDAAETGGFGFNVRRGDAAYAELRFGAELGAQVSKKVSGFVSGTVIHDLIDDPRSFRLSSSQLPTFTAGLPLREQDRFELSAGASVDVSETFSIDLGYLGDFNDGYSGHSARANVRIAF
ncbi:MAG: hypothetical protein SXU28_06070 [Pseudomonadota bacterium]|nr:hypothetical protein [Pseudomonadota bacterium]